MSFATLPFSKVVACSGSYFLVSLRRGKSGTGKYRIAPAVRSPPAFEHEADIRLGSLWIRQTSLLLTRLHFCHLFLS